MPESTFSDETTDDSPTETDGEPDSDELTRDDVFHVLQCRRRRLVLKYLQEYDGDEPARMGDIAEHIAALEHDTTVDSLRSQQRQRVYIALYQSHLPKMDKSGVIDYNQNRGFVETTSRMARFAPYLDSEPSLLGDEPDSEAVPEPSTPETMADHADGDTKWHRRYLSVAGMSLVTATAVSSGVASVSLPAGLGVGIIVSIVFGLLAVGHWLTESDDVDSESRRPFVRDPQ